MSEISSLLLKDLHPSQFYISERKLEEILRWFRPEDLSGFEPIPVKMLDGIPVMTDGHTRAVAALQAGLGQVPLVLDEDELDWDMYRACVRECENRGVYSPSDLLCRIIPEETYHEQWDKWCDALHAQIVCSRISIHEEELTEDLLQKLIALSADWEAEDSCYGYRKNEREDIEGNRIFTAADGGRTIGYLFGSKQVSKTATSFMKQGTAYFEVEELYVAPEYRGFGIGSALFRTAERAVRDGSDYLMLSTATKNWKAILHFYLDELGMEFWNARLFKRLNQDDRETDKEVP